MTYLRSTTKEHMYSSKSVRTLHEYILLTLEVNLILDPELIAYVIVLVLYTVTCWSFSYQAVILVLASVSSECDIRRGDVEAVSLERTLNFQKPLLSGNGAESYVVTQRRSSRLVTRTSADYEGRFGNRLTLSMVTPETVKAAVFPTLTACAGLWEWP